jgi:hypothetical protein
VTKRCVEEDLGLPGESNFNRLARFEIVKALRRERSQSVVGSDTVGPAAGEDTIWVLRHGNDHRGATWFDPVENVVWLCAYSRHRSGTPNDAFQRFPGLIRDGTMRPVAEDYEALADDRAERYAAVVATEGPGLLAQARATLGAEVREVIGTTQPVGLVVHVVETLEQTFVAVFGDRTDLAALQLLLVSLYPDHPFNDWTTETCLPTRELDHSRGEFCLSIVHESLGGA